MSLSISNRIKFVIIISLVIFSGLSRAEFTATNQLQLKNKLSQLENKSEGKFGIAFIDLKSGLEVTLNATSEFPAASCAKVSVMAAVYNLSYNNKVDLNQKVLFKQNDKLGGSGVLQWLNGEREYTLWNLIRLMIVLSDNTATRLVVNTIGIDNVNNYLAKEGLTRTKISDPTMLVEPPSSEVNVASPMDMARILLKIMKADGFVPKDSEDMLSFMKNQKYRWGIWRGVPPGVIVADKTGNLEGILNDAGIVYTKKGNYILSIFTWGFKKQKDARLLINEISKVAYEEYTGEKVERAVKAREVKIRHKTKIRHKAYKMKKGKKGKALIKKKITTRRLSHRPSAKYRRQSDRYGRTLDRKSHSYPRQ